MRNLFMALFLSGLSMISACNLVGYKKGNGDINTQTTSVDDFSKVNIGGNYHITLLKGVEEEVSVKTDENLHQYIEIRVENGELIINSDFNLKPTDKVQVDIYYQSLDHISSSGASFIEHSDVLTGEDLEIDMMGAGALKMDVDVEQLDINFSGAGLVELYGYTEYQNVVMSGAGAYKAESLTSKVSKINISGIGGADIYANEELDATITGLGDIKYYGNPSKIVRNVTGLGKIKRGENKVEEESGV